jgi:uncharacterized membrane protein
MDVVMVVLRLIHIFGGIFWVGAGLLMIGVVLPFAQTAGSDGMKFVQGFVGRSRYAMLMSLASVLVTLTGLLMYIRVSGGFQPVWIMTGPGVGFTIGSIAGILAWLEGLFIHRPIAERLKVLGQTIASAGGPPNAAQADELKSLQVRMGHANQLSAILLVTAAVFMAIARYL